MIDTVFVYGSLKSGQPSHGILDGCEFVSKGVLPHFGLVDLGNYPGLVPCTCDPSEYATGEVYSCDDIVKLIGHLDHFEHNGIMYLRLPLPVRLTDLGETRLCWSYVYLLGINVIPEGAWEGSNLDNQRDWRADDGL